MRHASIRVSRIHVQPLRGLYAILTEISMLRLDYGGLGLIWQNCNSLSFIKGIFFSLKQGMYRYNQIYFSENIN